MIKNELLKTEALEVTQENTLNEEWLESLAPEAEDEEPMENPWKKHREPRIRYEYWSDDDLDSDEDNDESF